MESGGNDGFGGDDIALLTEELIQLSVKSSMVEPSSNFSLICSVWTKKPVLDMASWGMVSTIAQNSLLPERRRS